MLKLAASVPLRLQVIAPPVAVKVASIVIVLVFSTLVIDDTPLTTGICCAYTTWSKT